MSSLLSELDCNLHKPWLSTELLEAVQSKITLLQFFRGSDFGTLFLWLGPSHQNHLAVNFELLSRQLCPASAMLGRGALAFFLLYQKPMAFVRPAYYSFNFDIRGFFCLKCSPN